MKCSFAFASAPFIVGFLAWMLSGSPLPMLFTALLLVLAVFTGSLSRFPSAHRALLFALPFLATAAGIWQTRLFQSGAAFAFRADLPVSFVSGQVLLWIAAAHLLGTRCLRSEKQHGAQRSPTPPATANLPLFAGLAGSLFVFSGTLGTERYDYGPWQLLPLAALPFAILLLFPLFLPDLRRRVFPLALALACLALTGLALSLETGSHRLYDWRHGKGSGFAEESLPDRPTPDASGETTASASRRLPRKADIRFDDRLRLFLKTESPELFQSWLQEPLYLRTSTVAIFESDEVISPVRSGRWIFAGDEDAGDDPEAIVLPSSPASIQPYPLHDYTLFVERDAAEALPLLVHSHLVKTDSIHEFADGWFQLAPPESIPRLRYTASAPLRGPAPPRAGADSFHYRQLAAPGIYLNLPPSPLAARVGYFCLEIEPREALSRIREFFRTETTYSLTYDTPEHLSPVENLLFGEKTGHCELYAAAAVMMLRSCGIPSRIAYGFTGGLADPREKIIAFRDRDFHAWSEILTPEQEWVVFDVTPEVSAAASRTPGRTTVTTVDWSSYEDYSPDRAGNAPSASWLEAAVADLSAFLAARFLLLTAGLALAFAALFRWRSRAEKNDARTTEPSSAAERSFRPAFLEELEAFGASRQIARGRGETWREFLHRLGQEIDPPKPVSAALQYYYRVRYAGGMRDRASEEAFHLAIREWKESHRSVDSDPIRDLIPPA